MSKTSKLQKILKFEEELDNYEQKYVCTNNPG